MSENYYCPECMSRLEKKEGCGSISYFCYTCKKLVSRSKMLTKDQMDEQKDGLADQRVKGIPVEPDGGSAND